VSPAGTVKLRALTTVKYHAPKFEANFCPDEVFIQTVLRSHFPEYEFFPHRVVEFLQEGRHAKVLCMEEFKALFSECEQTSTLLCVRKVAKAMQWEVNTLLGEKGVTNR
jgi:hypothetical protein